MLNYIIRRILYMIPIVIGVMFLTFILFFVVQTPEMMAKRILGPKAAPQSIQNWLHIRGYDKPRFINSEDGNPLDSQFFHHMKSLLTFELGLSDATREPVSKMFKRGAIPSLLITVPSFILGLFLSLLFSLLLVLVRDSKIDLGGTILCVILMSVPYLAFVMIGQWFVAIKLSLLPAFGFDLSGLATAKFLVLPIIIAVISGLGSDTRLYRTIFIEEIRKDYVRTALAKGASNLRVLFVHVLKNGMISLITLVVSSLPFLVMGSLVLENFFGIPGLGNLTINAIRTADFAVVRAVVYLGSLMYLVGLLATDLCYAAVDPRIRFRGSQ
jgi:peptide/nickel transport system permease protein